MLQELNMECCVKQTRLNQLFNRVFGLVPFALTFIEMRTALIFVALQPQDLTRIVHEISGKRSLELFLDDADTYI